MGNLQGGLSLNLYFHLLQNMLALCTSNLPRELSGAPGGKGPFQLAVFKTMRLAIAALTVNIMDGFVSGLIFDNCDKKTRDAVSEFIGHRSSSEPAFAGFYLFELLLHRS